MRAYEHVYKYGDIKNAFVVGKTFSIIAFFHFLFGKKLFFLENKKLLFLVCRCEMNCKKRMFCSNDNCG